MTDYSKKSPEEKTREIYDFFVEIGRRTMGVDTYHTIKRQFELRFPEFAEQPMSTSETALAKIESVEILVDELRSIKEGLLKQIKNNKR